MEIKYEAVFGNQALFDGMMGDCEFASEAYGYMFKNGVWYYCERYNEKAGWALSCKSHLTFKPSAMRRIIRTPTWSVADQKAGKLPEVGMIGALKNGREIEYLGKSVGGTLHHVRFVDDGECIRISLFDFFPIESPEEKAARLRKEWCKEAAGVCSLGMTTLTRIYDALLSGDLPVPNKG